MNGIHLKLMLVAMFLLLAVFSLEAVEGASTGGHDHHSHGHGHGHGGKPQHLPKPDAHNHNDKVECPIKEQVQDFMKKAQTGPINLGALLGAPLHMLNAGVESVADAFNVELDKQTKAQRQACLDLAKQHHGH